MTKDSGIDMVFDSIEIARKNGAEVNIMIGIDRKNTSKDMLMKLLNMGCNLFVHINREDKKIETRIYVFENEDGESFVYESCGKFSEGGLSSNYCLIQEISYLPEDKKAYENFHSGTTWTAVYFFYTFSPSCPYLIFLSFLLFLS